MLVDESVDELVLSNEVSGEESLDETLIDVGETPECQHNMAEHDVP